jgi:hypothetical protein
MSCVYLDMLHGYKVVSVKTDMFCVMCKKTNFGAKIIYFSWHKKYRFHVKLYVCT